MWVHGIGDHRPGWADPWRREFHKYLELNHDSYVEVTWDSVFDRVRRTRGEAEAAHGVELTPEEQLEEARVREQLETILIARASALEGPESTTRARGSSDGVIEWSELETQPMTRGLMPDWLLAPNESLGDFTKYLVSRNLRQAVKAQLKEKLRPLAAGDYTVSIVAHSWGTVVAYDSLLDLQVELPTLSVANLLTLGSPLWMVRHLLEDKSGRKPSRVGEWVNVHARGDLVGSWLKRGFQVDRDFLVPSVGGVSPHSSYFVEGNEAVQRDIVAKTILS